jgi:hypothetical protein
MADPAADPSPRFPLTLRSALRFWTARYTRRSAATILVTIVGFWLVASSGMFGRQARERLRPDGTGWRAPDGTAFAWRGITAFRLLEFVAHGREREADAYLAWAASEKVTIVRVLAMAHVLFQLTPVDGQAALGRLLDLAHKHGLAVEVVALADTASYTFDVSAHVRAVGAVAAKHRNVVIEMANEPYHPTQSADVHRHAYLRDLRQLIPSEVPVSLGTLDEQGDLAAGDYVTWHSPRDRDWPNRLREGASLLQRFRKPVIADEPMGAADRAIPGRRDDDPGRFRMAARICRETAIGATFHYEGGLQARRPTSRESACLTAWMGELKW